MTLERRSRFGIFLFLMSCLVVGVPAAHADTLVLTDNSGYPVGTWAEGSTHGNFFVNFVGFGTVSVVQVSSTNKVIELKPATSTSPSETHAALVTTLGSWGDLDTSVKMTTVQQLRTGSTPNYWEVAWFIWHYTDNDHFYYFTLKPNGWELGKRDPNYPGGQRFLATGSSPTLTFGATTIVRVRQVGNEIGIYLNNGAQLTYFPDNETPYTSGNIGYYTEDAQVRFDDLNVYTVP